MRTPACWPLIFILPCFDETGRPVSRVTTADIFTQDVFNGIKSDYSYYYPLNSPVTFNLVSVNRDGYSSKRNINRSNHQARIQNRARKKRQLFSLRVATGRQGAVGKRDDVQQGGLFVHAAFGPAITKYALPVPGATVYVAGIFTAMVLTAPKHPPLK